MTHNADPRDQAKRLHEADIDAATKAAKHRRHPLVQIAGTLSEIADQPQLAAVCGLTLAAGLARGDRRLARTGIRMLLAHALATAGKTWVKDSVVRTRPFVLLDEGRYEVRRGKGKGSEEASFPSGHTAGAVAVACAVVREYPVLGVPAFGAAAAIAAIQVPRAKHYPADLAAGLLVGLAAGAVANLGVSMALAAVSGE
jgi:undecaprenyl-diphosphatase